MKHLCNLSRTNFYLFSLTRVLEDVEQNIIVIQYERSMQSRRLKGALRCPLYRRLLGVLSSRSWSVDLKAPGRQAFGVSSVCWKKIRVRRFLMFYLVVQKGALKLLIEWRFLDALSGYFKAFLENFTKWRLIICSIQDK